MTQDLYLTAGSGISIVENTSASTITINSTSTSGWQPVSDTWTYASGSTINVPSGATAIYAVDGKIKFNQHGVTKYGYINPTSTTLLTFYAGNVYTVENTATYPITGIYYSNVASLVGFPYWFNYTPTGIANSNVALTGRFSNVGGTTKVQFRAAFTGGITFTTMPTLPIAVASTSLDMSNTQQAGYVDAGTAWVPNGLNLGLTANATTFGLQSGAGGTPMSATSPITWANNDNIEAYFEYEHA